jgi:hypothetical protein
VAAAAADSYRVMNLERRDAMNAGRMNRPTIKLDHIPPTLPFGFMSLEEVEQTQSPFHYLTHWLDRRRQYFIGRDLAAAFAAHSTLGLQGFTTNAYFLTALAKFCSACQFSSRTSSKKNYHLTC